MECCKRNTPRWLALALLWGCADDSAFDTSSASDGAIETATTVDAGADASRGEPGALTLRKDVEPIKRADDALPGVFIPPFEDCRPPVAGDRATRADGLVCANVAISGGTEEGKYFPDYAACEIVRSQRPYWPAPPSNATKADDPRLDDPAFLQESTWAAEQIGATGCACCHDGRVIAASQWDIALGPLWIDSLSDTGLALFAGLADSSVLGAYPPDENYELDRERAGAPSTDPARMKAFALAELARRGLNEAWARAVPPFGGPIYTNSVAPPAQCSAGQGIAPNGSVHWTGGDARYVYVLRPGSKNPGVPPNLDLPEGTVWRLDVLASQPALKTGVGFGRTPRGSFQVFPREAAAQPLVAGERYQLFVLRDVGLPLVNCLFEFGRDIPAPAAPAAGADDAGVAIADAAPDDAGAQPGMCTLPGGNALGFGAPCDDTTTHSECSCAADYCSKSPFDAQGYCSVSGCKEDPSVCPAGWSCFDVSIVAPGQPSVCMRP